MLFQHLARGAKAGLTAGLVFGLFVALVANPLVALAAGGEHPSGHADGTAAGHTDGQAAHDGVVSAAVTDAVSVVAGGLWGLLLGVVVFGVGFFLLEPALPGSGATDSVVIAGLGFLTVSGGPWLVLPPRLPEIEQSLATGAHPMVYAGAMATAAVASLLSLVVYDRVARRRGTTLAAVAAVVPFCLLALPVALTPASPSAGALADALTAGPTGVVVFGQVLLWATLAGTHVWLGRSSAGPASPAEADTRPGRAAE